MAGLLFSLLWSRRQSYRLKLSWQGGVIELAADLGWEEITDSETWDKPVQGTSYATFLQAYSFGEFNRSLGNKVWRLWKKEGDNLTGWVSVIEVTSKLGH